MSNGRKLKLLGVPFFSVLYNTTPTKCDDETIPEKKKENENERKENR
jgi:hypothetical protein